MTQMSHLYALLIGIDYYMYRALPDGTYYKSLKGSVRDIDQAEEFLRTRLGMGDNQIVRLASTEGEDKKPVGPEEQWPTYENMVSAFWQVKKMAQPGDRVFIHYSGHGGRTKTAYQELKATGLDEALVPTDIGDPNARYLRDVELAYLLQEMADKNLIVTMVLDSCHSGGATRGLSDVTVRGVEEIDTTERPTDSLVASPDELIHVWQRRQRGATRAVSQVEGWLPEPEGYVLLTACRAQEFAVEYAFDGENKHGVLTYWLMDGLQQLGPGLTYRHLHNRILAKVHTQFNRQTPQLMGEGDRRVFGSEQVRANFAVTVMDVDMPNHRIKLEAGQVHGLRKGAEFAVYPGRGTNFEDDATRLARAKIIERRATESWARLLDLQQEAVIEQGDQAVLLNPASIRLQRAVCLVEQDNLPASIDQEKAQEAIRIALETNQTSFVTLVEGGGLVNFQVAVNFRGEYEFWDSAGSLLPNLLPPIKINASGAADKVVQRLIHLTKYYNVQELDNTDVRSPLAGKLKVELMGLQDGFKWGDKPIPQPLTHPSHTPVFKPGDYFCLQIQNASDQVLNITALALQADWSIGQIYPNPNHADFEPFDPGQMEIRPFRADVPDGYTQTTDIVKAFATVGSARFRWLQLPALDQPHINRSVRAITDPLEALIASVTIKEPSTRTIEPSEWKWAMAQVEIHTYGD